MDAVHSASPQQTDCKIVAPHSAAVNNLVYYITLHNVRNFFKCVWVGVDVLVCMFLGTQVRGQCSCGSWGWRRVGKRGGRHLDPQAVLPAQRRTSLHTYLS